METNRPAPGPPEADREGLPGRPGRLLCQLVEARLFIKKEKGTTYVIRDKNGDIKYVAQFPQVSIAQKSIDICHRFLKEFGLTPASAERLERPDGAAAADDPMGEFLKRGKKGA